MAQRILQIFSVLMLLFCATIDARERKIKLPKGVTVPNQTELAIYIPPNQLNARFYLPNPGVWVELGEALSSARDQIGARLFSTFHPVTPGASEQYGLVLDIDPEWDADRGRVILTLDYVLRNTKGETVHSGKQTHSERFDAGGPGGGISNAALQAMQNLMVDVLTVLRPDPAQFPATGHIDEIPIETLVDMSEPVKSGTGFFVDAEGSVLTAAHVARDCPLLEGFRDGKTFTLTPVASSAILDLALLRSGLPSTQHLTFREGHDITLGEAVTNVGYPLQGVMAPTPNITRGNISARAGLQGSMGVMQFSAPIQPGSSGGPVVSDHGELLGVTVGTMNISSLVERGVLPQNVNFALEARLVSQFLSHNGAAPVTKPKPLGNGSMEIANEAALGSVIRIKCYE